MKSAVGRSRPSRQEVAFNFRPFGGGVSAPSGHTTEAFTLGVVSSEHYPPGKLKVLLRPDFGPGYQGAALSVGF